MGSFKLSLVVSEKTLCNIAFAAHITHLNVCFNFEKQIFLDFKQTLFYVKFTLDFKVT